MYHGIQDIKNQCYSEDGPLIILENYELFPCFDCHDYATDK